MTTKRLGNKGERLAAAYLRRSGYRILRHQFHSKFGEVDIVAVDGQTLVFVEVKTRSSTRYGTGLEAITPLKIRRIVKAGQYYRLLHPKTPAALRIDAIEVYFADDEKSARVRHVRNVSSG